MNGIVQTLVNIFGWQTITLWVLEHVLDTQKGLAAFQEISPIIARLINAAETPASSAS